MSDETTTLAQLRRQIAHFVAARAWETYHTPKNLSVAIAIEAAELMEHFLWLSPEQAAAAMEDPRRRAAVVDELADVLIYALSMANALGTDVSEAVRTKLARNEQRFPPDQWRGRARGVDDASVGTTG
ncbi:MAG TPA: nucleotide pyrophosphohydrolase [Thermoflexia bacterium]|jgi:NTP pyrophosphatase (non-canonical NTP hydrolase)|nr:nucleotide pyrophosphohydrolase [Thermoflexia bacterium]